MQFLGLKKKKYQISGLNLYFLFTFQPSTIKTPPLRPFVRPPSPPPPPPIRPSPPPISTELPEPEVLFAGQAFDIDPSRPPQAGRPEIFDLTVSVKQNFGGNRVQSQNKGKTFFVKSISRNFRENDFTKKIVVRINFAYVGTQKMISRKKCLCMCHFFYIQNLKSATQK